LQFLLWQVFIVPASAAERPNILFVMSDDHGYQAVGAYGSGLAATPNIDRIAAAGVRFDRCYVTNSLCGPSRATILTGKYSHKNGFYDNVSQRPFDGSQQTFPKLLQSAGYQTAVVGKWHLKSEPTGFDHWEILPGQGRYYRPEFITPSGQRAEDGYVTELITDKALDWLRTGRDRSKPFCLLVHHKATHRPWEPSAKYLARFQGKEFPQPATLMDDYATRPAAARADMRITQMAPATDLKIWEPTNPARRALYRLMGDAQRSEWERVVDPRLSAFKMAFPSAGPSPEYRGGEEARRMRWFYQIYLQDYLACVASVDESVGRLLNYLDESGLAANTIVVYTSDQGFYLGEHGWFDKRFMYEESLRTPLVFRWPGVTKPGQVNDRMVSNVDFAETFLEAAGVGVPADMQGRSLAALLRGESPADWRQSFYYHFYEDEDSDHHVPRHEGVTNGRAKLIHFYKIGDWELFDLQRDPHELVNVYGRPEYAKMQAELVTELERLRKELNVPALE
jgi:arylsulfatase A-like enzyme